MTAPRPVGPGFPPDGAGGDSGPVMPPPATTAELVDRLRKSGLVPDDRLDTFLTGLQAAGTLPRTPAEFLARLADTGLITPFHADRLAAGKYKGFLLGNYLILDQIGTGGMGQVYLAEHSAMRRLVALKVLPVFAVEDIVARERFLREARASACLDHPNIVRTFDLCEEGRLLYLVMEYVEGISLQALVGRHGPLDVTAACHYARQIAFGLQHAHDRGFVHRDVKPANLLLDRDGVVKLLDLGLVRSEAEAASGLTRKLDNRSILGTADYVAPEQAVDSSGVDQRADLYSLGATLYFLLAGRPLFPEGRTAQKLVWQQVKEPVPIDRLRPEVPPDLAAVVHTLLQKRPGDRYQTAGEVFLALEPWSLGPVPPPDESLLSRPPARPSGTVALRHARTSGTAQVLSAALRGGGSGSRPGIGVVTPPPRPSLPDAPPRADESEETGAVALDKTTRTPGSGPRVVVPETLPPVARRPAPTWRATVLVAGGLVAAGAVICGLLVLVLKG